MNLLDILLIIPFVWMIFRGFARGFILALTSLIALFAGVFLSVNYSDVMAGLLRNELGMKSEYINVIAFAATFFIVVIAVQLMGYLLHSVIKLAALGIINRLVGAAFGLVKAILFTGTILFIINSFDTSRMILSERMRSESRLYEPLSRVIPMIWPRMQGWIRDADKFKQTDPKQSPVVYLSSGI